MKTKNQEKDLFLKKKLELHSGFLNQIISPSLTGSIIAVFLALLCGATLIGVLGVNPLVAYKTLLVGALGSKNSIAETLVRAIPLALVGIGVSVAFRGGVFNIGGEGQLYLGAIAATWIGLNFSVLPRVLLLPLMILASMLIGGIWAFIPGLLKTRFNASELINTIMMNYIAIFLVSYLIHGPLKEPGSPLGQSSLLPSSAQLRVLLPATRLHSGILITILAIIITYILLWHTSWGFHLRASGKNPIASSAAGINVRRITSSVFLLSGALAGLAGFCEVAGVHRRMLEYISPGYGYTAIVVALLGQTNPMGVMAAAVLFAGLQVGASTMESAIGVPSSIVTIVQYLIIIFLIGKGALSFFRKRYSPMKEQEI